MYYYKVKHTLDCAAIFSLILVLFLPTNGLAIYDLLGIDVINRNNQITFCIDPDYNRNPLFWGTNTNPYVVAILNNTAYFLANTDAGLAITPWEPGIEPPLFTQKSGPSCLGPFSNDILSDIQMFAGIGTSFDDLINNGRYIRFFNGFPDLKKSVWTVMVYIVASNLETHYPSCFASKDMLEMLEGSTFDDDEGVVNDDEGIVNIVTCTGGSTRTGWQTVKRSLIQKGQHYVLEDIGPKAMSNPEILVDFVSWATDAFPADHYALILWNHGMGIGGFGYDTSVAGNRSIMSLDGLHQAFKSIRSHAGSKFDIVVYDACLMGSIEVAEVTASLADYMAASADLVPYHGLNYSYLLAGLAGAELEGYENNGNAQNGMEFGRLALDGYFKEAKEKDTIKNKAITYAVYDLNKLEGFNQAFERFSKSLNEKLDSYEIYENISHGLIRTIGYPNKNLKNFDNDPRVSADLYGFIQNMASKIPDLANESTDVINALDQVVCNYDDNLYRPDSLAAKAISIDLGNLTDHLKTLPESFQLVHAAMESYRERKKNDFFLPDGTFIILECPPGVICADTPTWLELNAEDVIGVNGYFGGNIDGQTIISLIMPVYQGEDVTSDLMKIQLERENACVYKICVDEQHCGNITLTNRAEQNVLLGEAYVNGVRSIMTFCLDDKDEEDEENVWASCGYDQQIDGIWNRTMNIQLGDTIAPVSTLFSRQTLEKVKGNTLTVESKGRIVLKKDCTSFEPVILASFFGPNGLNQCEQLCVGDDCVYAGVIIKK